jgi:hypothetical protein
MRKVLVFLVLFSVLPQLSVASNSKEFSSPKGKVRVQFKEATSHKASDPQDTDVSRIEYKVDFYDSENRMLKETWWTDVYGWDGAKAKPTPLGDVFMKMRWSPEENFVFFPPEQFAGAPGTECENVVSLSPHYKWETTVCLGLPIWLDNFRVLGNNTQDCNYRVQVFDGKTGKERTIIPPGMQERNTPLGLEILPDTKNITVRTTLDNCAVQKDREGFTPKCWLLNPKDESLRDVRCPTP